MKDILIGMWVDSEVRKRQFEYRIDGWIEAWMHEIEKEISLDELELAYERFVKRGDEHLYKGAAVRTKRPIPYSELFNDFADEYPIAADDYFFLGAGWEGQIVDTWLDADESDNGYFDCSVNFPEHGSWLCRVEWLDWECDDDDDES